MLFNRSFHNMTDNRIALISALHPKMAIIAKSVQQDLERLYEAKKSEFRFQIFETLRLAARQADAKARGTSKAGPWESAHNVGLAIDCVPYLTAQQAVKYRPAGSSLPGWYWPPSYHESWNVLTSVYERHDLNTLTWDRPHGEHPLFDQMQKIGF